MAGLTSGGFVPETYDAIKDRIEGKLDALNPGFDLSPDSPDGQIIGIITYEMFVAWSELNRVYNSYNPLIATGAALKNLGLITGLVYGAATKSSATLETQGTTGTIIPAQSLVTDNDGNDFYTSFDTAIPSNLQVVAVVAGIIPVAIASILTIKTPVSGWTGVTQTQLGIEGQLSQTEQQYRNTRQRTVMRNHTSVPTTMQARLIELGVSQANVINNTSAVNALVDGTPPNTIHVTVGELGAVSRVDVATTILVANGMGCPTYGNTSEIVEDSHGVSHTIYFSIASAVNIRIEADVTYLSENIAGANLNIEKALFNHVNTLLSGDDVVWSRLFGYITPFAKAQVNTLTISIVGNSQGIANVVLDTNEFASLAMDQIVLTVDGV
jgi:uncharacterized phage protein gp47/JayE